MAGNNQQVITHPRTLILFSFAAVQTNLNLSKLSSIEQFIFFLKINSKFEQFQSSYMLNE